MPLTKLPAWIRHVPEVDVKRWIQHSPTPMMRSKLDGRVLGCNAAMEALCGYTADEYASGMITWHELTPNEKDREIDRQLAIQVAVGERDRYSFSKSYRTKNAGPVDVQIHVLLSRETDHAQDDSPEELERVVFLVTVVPVGANNTLMVNELAQMRMEFLELRQVIIANSVGGVCRDAYREVKALVIANPYISFVVLLILGGAVFGDWFRDAVGWAVSMLQGLVVTPKG